MRNIVPALFLAAAVLLSGAACSGGEQPEPERSPDGTTTSAPTKRKPSSPEETRRPDRGTTASTPRPEPRRTSARTSSPTDTAAPTPGRTSLTPAPSLTGREGVGPSTFTPGSEQSTLDEWRRGQCEAAGYGNCE